MNMKLKTSFKDPTYVAALGSIALAYEMGRLVSKDGVDFLNLSMPADILGRC